jgi:type VI secretion system protein VasD
MALKLDAAAQLNGTPNHSLPVVVRVYTLSNADNFNDATFHALWRNPKLALGDTLINQQEYILTPNSQLTLTLPRDPSAKFIAAVALFRHPHGEQWRASRAMPSRLGAVFHTEILVLSGNSIAFK